MAEPLVVVWFRLDQAVESFHYLSVSDQHSAYATYAGGTFIGRLKIYRYKILHLLVLIYYIIIHADSSSKLSGDLLAKPQWTQHLHILSF